MGKSTSLPATNYAKNGVSSQAAGLLVCGLPLHSPASGTCRGLPRPVCLLTWTVVVSGRRVAMSTTLKIRDETTSSAGGDSGEFTLEVLTERITLRELIRTRVHQEVRDYNLRQPEYFRGLVQPSGAEL